MTYQKIETGPNMLLIVIDALRKDTLDDNPASLPNLKRILADPEKYDDFISPSSWTLPPMPSRFRGFTGVGVGRTRAEIWGSGLKTEEIRGGWLRIFAE